MQVYILTIKVDFFVIVSKQTAEEAESVEFNGIHIR